MGLFDRYINNAVAYFPSSYKCLLYSPFIEWKVKNNCHRIPEKIFSRHSPMQMLLYFYNMAQVQQALFEVIK